MHEPRPEEIDDQGQPPPPEPVFNLPRIVRSLALLLIGIYAADWFLMPMSSRIEVLLAYGFLPARYLPDAVELYQLPGGEGAKVWSFLTYAFLHGSWAHLFVNVMWMVVFGSAVARRFGAARFLLLSAVCAVAGAALHLAFHFGELVPMIGASAAISGQMAAATRFVFDMGGPLGAMRRTDDLAYQRPASNMLTTLSNPRVAMFMLVWFGLNLLFGVVSVPIVGEGGSIAWEAHIGGFVAGFALFSLFDPVPRRRNGG